MGKRSFFLFIIVAIALFILTQILVGQFWNNQEINIQTMTNTKQVSPQKLYEKTWKEVNNEFYDSTMNGQEWKYWKTRYKGKIKTDDDAKVAIETMIASLNDDYTRFLAQKEYAEQNTSIESKISGIGVNIMNDAGKIVVFSVLDDTPAKEAGILSNDIINKVDGKKVSGMNIAEVSTLVRGEVGTKVRLELIRNKRIIHKTVTRRTIKVHTVKSSIKNGIAYIQISTFIGNSTSEEFLEALKQTQDAKGLILDLRGNTGGLFNNAVFIANTFLNKGTIVSIVSRNGKQEDIKAREDFLSIYKKPIIVLVDGASASASEILSGALKDHKKAILVGTKTFGKGMVQRIIPLPNSTGVNVTIAKYLTPNGSDINKKGIVPDYVVRYSEADIKKHNDPQLKKAESLISNMIKK